MRFITLISALALTLLAGCSSTPPQAPIALDDPSQFYASGKVAIVVNTPEKADTYFPGANCLLCAGAAAMMNSSLTNHTQALPVDDFTNLPHTLKDELTALGKDVVLTEGVVPSKLKKYKSDVANTARRDFSGVASQYGADQVLVVDLSLVGVVRTYASYVPTSDPIPTISGAAYIVNAADQKLVWYAPIRIAKNVEGEWDEADQGFPGVTNAYYQAVEEAMDTIREPVSQAVVQVSAD